MAVLGRRQLCATTKNSWRRARGEGEDVGGEEEGVEDEGGRVVERIRAIRAWLRQWFNMRGVCKIR